MYVQPGAENGGQDMYRNPFSYSAFPQNQSPQSVMSSLVSAVVTLCTLLIWRVEASSCYNIDGSLVEGTEPCYDLNTVDASMCCYGDDKCLPEGLCAGSSPHGPVGEFDDNSSIWRKSCSDKTWKNRACLAIAPCRYFL